MSNFSISTSRIKNTFNVFFCLMLSLITIGQDRNNTQAPSSIMTYNLPSGRNGLSETSFRVSSRVNIVRWEKASTIEVKLDWSEGTASNLNPAFKFDYIYKGVHYGNQHLGKDPFYDISVERGSVRFKTLIMFREQIISRESEYVGGTSISNAPVDLKASEVSVVIKEITYVGFRGTTRIEKQINEILASTKKKENYSRLIKEADQNMEQKNWASAISKYESATGLFPDESYPKTQLNKINELKKAELSKVQQGTATAASNGSSSTSSANTKTTTGSSSTSNTTAASQTSANGNKGSGNSSSTPSNTGNVAPPNSPQFVRDNAGRYYEKDANNIYREVSSGQYEQGKNNLLKQKQDAAQAVVDANNAKILKDLQNRAQASEDALLKNMNPDPVNEAEKWANQQQSFYAAQAVSGAKNSLENNSRLNGNFSSIQEIEAEFNQKYSSINRDVENLKSAKNQKLQSDYNTIFYGSDAKGQAVGQLAAGIGSLINEASAAREARLAKEALEAQKKAEIAKIEERQKQARIDIRNKLFSQFPDGGLPLSSHRIMNDEVYLFSYVFDKSEIAKEKPVLYLTDIFPIAKYGDGTWPFKNAVVGDISKLAAAGPVTIMGYYTTNEMTVQMRNSFKSLSEKSGIIVKDITYKGKAASATGNGKTDLWGNEIKTNTSGKASKEPESGIDFWGNPVSKETNKQSNVQPVSKEKPKAEVQNDAKVDFWGNPIKSNTKDTIPKKTDSTKTTNTKAVTLDFWGNPIKK